MDDGGIKLELPKEKNHTGEIKDPYAVSAGKGSHDTMMRSICIDSGLDFKDRSITNHSMRSMGIHNLVESSVTLDEQMTFSRHKTIAGVSAYQHQSIKRK
ncbi:unnamed protein product [Rhizophagus irregularis]|nr:unnamed protein product [Rhizophagus irregularis]